MQAIQAVYPFDRKRGGRMKQNMKKRFAIYSRKSKFTGKGESIENQIELCRRTEVWDQQIYRTQRHFRSAAAVQPPAVSAGQGSSGYQQGTAPHSGWYRHAKKIQQKTVKLGNGRKFVHSFFINCPRLLEFFCEMC